MKLYQLTQVIILLFLSARVYAAPIDILGFNLITNGDAESGISSATGTEVVPVPGWNTSGNFTVTSYGAVITSGAFPALGSPGPSDRGSNFFSGGASNNYSYATQLLDISEGASLIDSGYVKFDISGFFGGFDNQDDHASLIGTFLDGAGNNIGSTTIGPVLAADRADITGLLFREETGFVPTGTRQILLSLEMVRPDGQYNDGYADNLSLSLTAVPIPSAAWLFATGLISLVSVARRRF